MRNIRIDMRNTRIIILLASVLCLTGGALPTSAGSLPEIQKGGILHAATEGQYPPFNFFDNKKLSGFEVDLINSMAEKMKLKAEWQTFSFDSLLIGLSNKRYDMVIASHAITPERARAVDFTDPYYCSGGAIFSKNGGAKTAADLKGKTVAVAVGTSYAPMVTAMVGKDAKQFPSDVAAVQALMSGKVDAAVTDKFVLLDLQRQGKVPGTQIGDFIDKEKVAMAVAKGNSSLREGLNLALKEVMKDGTYARLSKKYFGLDIRCE
jgi:polar amino acid transport system substrate-binding protein